MERATHDCPPCFAALYRSLIYLRHSWVQNCKANPCCTSSGHCLDLSTCLRIFSLASLTLQCSTSCSWVLENMYVYSHDWKPITLKGSSPTVSTKRSAAADASGLTPHCGAEGSRRFRKNNDRRQGQRQLLWLSYIMTNLTTVQIRCVGQHGEDWRHLGWIRMDRLESAWIHTRGVESSAPSEHWFRQWNTRMQVEQLEKTATTRLVLCLLNYPSFKVSNYGINTAFVNVSRRKFFNSSSMAVQNSRACPCLC